MKTCRKCKSIFDGVRCLNCKKLSAAAYYLLNISRIKAKNLIYRIENAEKLKERSAKYRTANIEKVRAASAVCRAADPAGYKARDAEYRAKNKEKMKAYGAAYRAKNPEKLKELNIAWRKKNPDSVRASSQNRRARKRANGGALSVGLVKKLLNLQRGKCACCKQPLGDNYHLDHIMPLALGGSNTDDNMQLLTARCNTQKQAKHPVDFMQSRGFLL